MQYWCSMAVVWNPDHSESSPSQLLSSLSTFLLQSTHHPTCFFFHCLLAAPVCELYEAYEWSYAQLTGNISRTSGSSVIT